MNARPSQHRHRHGLTLIEVALIAAILAILALVILPALYAPRRPSARMSCANHLKSLSLAFRLYSSDSGGRFPVFSTNDWQTGDDWEREFLGRWRLLSNELGTPKLLVCPSDQRLPPPNFSVLASSSISYFLNADGGERAEIVLLGDRNLTAAGKRVSPGVLSLSTNLEMGWTPELHQGRGNTAFGDGSVQPFADPLKLNRALRPAALATNRLFVP